MTYNSKKSEGQRKVETIITEIDAGQGLVSETTIAEVESVNPHCLLPANYFEFAIATGGISPQRRLSINSWDGREILSVARKH